MQLRSSELLGTDLVALSLWPDADELGADPGADPGAAPESSGPGTTDLGLPWETRCVDAALAAAFEYLVGRVDPALRAPEPDEGDQQRAARSVLRWLLARAQRLQRRTD